MGTLTDDETAVADDPYYTTSFDCTKVLIAAESLVCHDPELANLDLKLARAYRTLLARSEQPEAERSTRMRWLADKRNACDSVACLRKAYRQRLKYFEGAPHYAYSEHAQWASNGKVEIGWTVRRRIQIVVNANRSH